MPTLLKHWVTHAEYQHFISEVVTLLNPSQLKKRYFMSDFWNKHTSMNLDPVEQFLIPFYSNTGRPDINHPQILRSFILMLDRKFTSLTNWVTELQSDDLLAILMVVLAHTDRSPHSVDVKSKPFCVVITMGNCPSRINISI